ncbi:hypothetical protein RHO14_02390 [Orbus wheelerorum]|uniref:hypothetical protein n=1 Tax=Orbus wheelerorum TaxID=3074111 RepID=UPI00370DA55C
MKQTISSVLDFINTRITSQNFKVDTDVFKKSAQGTDSVLQRTTMKIEARMGFKINHNYKELIKKENGDFIVKISLDYKARNGNEEKHFLTLKNTQEFAFRVNDHKNLYLCAERDILNYVISIVYLSIKDSLERIFSGVGFPELGKLPSDYKKVFIV